MKKKTITGFSLIEILVFTTILNLFFIVALTVTVFTLRNLQANEHKIVAIHYLDQLKEWVTYEKEKDWDTFFQKTGTYCFNNATLSWSSATACSAACPGSSCLGNMFNREAVLSQVGDTIQVNMQIKWTEIDKIMTATSSSFFSLWEK